MTAAVAEGADDGVPSPEAPLKPCPFCGGEARVQVAPEVWVKCLQCGAEGPLRSLYDSAIAAWNRRAP